MVAAWARGVAVAPYPAKARLGLCCGRTTHGGDTREKRACSQHIYILCNIYIEGYTGFVHESSAVPAPVQSGRGSPWWCTTVARPPEVRSGRFLGFALPGWAPGVGWTGKGTNRGQRVSQSRPHSGSLQPLTEHSQVYPGFARIALAKAGREGPWKRSARFVPKAEVPPASA